MKKYDLVNSMHFGFCESPKELAEEYGFSDTGLGIVYTTADGIEFGGSWFFGEFHYEDEYFKSLVLRPITGIEDDYQSEAKVTAEKDICDKAIASVGNRVGQFQIKLVETQNRNAGTHGYIIYIMEHPFFTEMYDFLEDSSMTDEEIVNFVMHLEDALDKYKNML